jgi:hypothetical protein
MMAKQDDRRNGQRKNKVPLVIPDGGLKLVQQLKIGH